MGFNSSLKPVSSMQYVYLSLLVTAYHIRAKNNYLASSRPTQSIIGFFFADVESALGAKNKHKHPHSRILKNYPTLGYLQET
jgi:hypothetical protein